jgi:very-short-patch-repair endonuclease
MTEPPEPHVEVATAARLRARGASKEQIRARIRNGDLVVIGRGVYVTQAVAREFDSVPNSRHVLRAAGAVVLAGPGSVVSHKSAALIHDLAIVGDPPTELTITSGTGRRGRRHGVHRYQTALPTNHVTRRYGLPVTTVARTVVDLARTMPYREGVVAADSALFRGLAVPIDLWATAEECRHLWGAGTADRVVRFADSQAESPLESLARVLLDEAQLPAPELQVPIYNEEQFIGRVDFLWRRHKVIVEVDGGAKYTNPGRARAQLWRDKALRAAGYDVIHFSWAEITTQPEMVIAAVWAALQARGLPKSAA